jgi:hypothetical protein
MTSEARAALREKVAKVMWAAVTDLKAEFREAVWAGTHPRTSAYLEDEDSEESKAPFLCAIGRNTFRRMADAVIDVALEEAARVCDAYAEKDWARGEGFRNRAALDLAAAIRGLISYTQDAKRG